MKKIVLGFLVFSQMAAATPWINPDTGNPLHAAGVDQGHESPTASQAAGIGSGTASVNTSAATKSSGPVFSGKGLSGGADLVEKELAGSVSKEHDIKKLIIGFTNFLLPLSAAMAVLAIVWAGFLYITAFGDDGRMDQAKNIIIWAVIGLVVIAAAYAIVNFAMSVSF